MVILGLGRLSYQPSDLLMSLMGCTEVESALLIQSYRVLSKLLLKSRSPSLNGVFEMNMFGESALGKSAEINKVTHQTVTQLLSHTTAVSQP